MDLEQQVQQLRSRIHALRQQLGMLTHKGPAVNSSSIDDSSSEPTAQVEPLRASAAADLKAQLLARAKPMPPQ